MRRSLVVAVAFVGAFVPSLGNAQVYSLPTPAPAVTAASASWQLNGEPVFHAGSFYYPSGPTVYFDGNVMVRVGTYRSVPLYADSTLEPYSIVYVPVGGLVMRPYERLREGELAGTTGSRAPSFPVQSDVELSAESGVTGLVTPALPPPQPEQNAIAESVPPPVTFRGAIAAQPSPLTTETKRTPTIVQSIPAPQSNRGVWIEYEGTRWYSAGDAVTYAPDRFVPVGDYHGFPVYEEKNGAADEIYIPAVPDGPLTPYQR